MSLEMLGFWAFVFIGAPIGISVAVVIISMGVTIGKRIYRDVCGKPSKGGDDGRRTLPDKSRR